MTFRARTPGLKGLKHVDLGLVPLAVLVFGLLLTAGALWAWNSALDAQDRARFSHEAEALESLIGRRMARAVNGLDDIAAIHAVTGRLDAGDLRLYLAKRELGRDDSGIRGFGVIEHLDRDEVPAFEARQRQAGVPGFPVRARGRGEADLFVVRSLEPSAQNKGAVGFDVGSIPAARAALERAIDSGEATFSEPLTLLQDEGKGLGMVLYLPIYRGSPRTTQERRQALALIVFAPIVAREMLASALNQLGVDLHVWLYDETDGGRRLVYSETPTAGARWNYLSSREIKAGGRAYILDVAAGPRPRPLVDRLVPWVMAILGVGLTLALTVLTRLLDLGRTKAIVQADSREQFLRTITDHLPARISYWDREGRCLFANLRFREVLGIGDADLSSIPAAISGKLDEPNGHDQPVLQGMPQQFEQDLLEASGRRSTWQVHYIPDFDGDVVQGYFVLATEVTELKKARDLALRASNAKTEFLATMSHEIRTPMTGVLGMVDLLEQEDLQPHVRRFVDSIRVSGRHLLHVINDILDFSRLQSGRLQLEQVTFAIPDMIEQVRSIMAPLAAERRLAFSCDIDESIPGHLSGDPTRLRQVLLNIVGNAVKFTERGSIAIAVSAVGPPDDQGSVRLRFQVRDTGIGIAPEYLRNVFDAFDQADNSIARRYGGSGLGLAISQQIVRAMGGEIAVESSPGQGSRFSFEIPFPVAQGPQAGAEAQGAPVPPSRPLAVLVVEDVEVNRDILGIALARAGHSVTFAHDGQQAIDHVRRERFDVVLMDVQMPVMDGVQATRQIRRLGGACASLPILGLTASVMAHERESYLAAGMDACLRKPIVWDELWATLGRFTGPRHSGQPVAAGTTAEAEPALVDPEAIDKLRQLAGAPALATMLASTLETARQCCDGLQQQREQADLIAQAHKLKGTAGTFGLKRLAAQAQHVETLAATGEDVGPSVQALRRLLSDTRAEMERLHLIPARASE